MVLPSLEIVLHMYFLGLYASCWFMQVVKVTSQKQIELEESLDILRETASQVGFQSK